MSLPNQPALLDRSTPLPPLALSHRRFVRLGTLSTDARPAFCFLTVTPALLTVVRQPCRHEPTTTFRHRVFVQTFALPNAHAVSCFRSRYSRSFRPVSPCLVSPRPCSGRAPFAPRRHRHQTATKPLAITSNLLAPAPFSPHAVTLKRCESACDSL